MGEEEEEAWPERSEDSLDQSCVCHTRSSEKQVLFVSMPFQSWALSLAESHTLPWLQSSPAFSHFPKLWFERS